MFKSAALPILFSLSLVAACGQAPPDRTPAEPEAEAKTKSITAPNPSHEALLKLDDLQRNLTLRRAIRDGQGSCSKITDSKYQQKYRTMEMWVARCTGGDWAVFIAPSGNVQARACGDIPILNAENKGTNLPRCTALPLELSGPDEPL